MTKGQWRVPKSTIRITRPYHDNMVCGSTFRQTASVEKKILHADVLFDTIDTNGTAWSATQRVPACLGRGKDPREGPDRSTKRASTPAGAAVKRLLVAVCTMLQSAREMSLPRKAKAKRWRWVQQEGCKKERGWRLWDSRWPVEEGGGMERGWRGMFLFQCNGPAAVTFPSNHFRSPISPPAYVLPHTPISQSPLPPRSLLANNAAAILELSAPTDDRCPQNFHLNLNNLNTSRLKPTPR
jgi:hypothetical protein